MQPHAIAVGDLQGCLAPLQQLQRQFPPDIPVWFCGDVVNRGPQSLATLRHLKNLGRRALTVLGNHDLHLLAVAYGIRPAQTGDTLDEILAAPDRDDLLTWLRCQPLAHFEYGHLLVHAGVLPHWTLTQTLDFAAQAQEQLSAANFVEFLAQLFSKTPDKKYKEVTQAVSVMTRIRFCDAHGAPIYAPKMAPLIAPKNLLPWFEFPERKTQNITVVFGHWAALGLMLRPHVMALDSGCVWGNALTAVALCDDPAQRQVWQVPCESRARAREDEVPG